MDFTLQRFQVLLESLIKSGYSFQPFRDFLKHPLKKVIILRHDVDKLPLHSLKIATAEYNLGIAGTYFFRNDKCSYNETVIKKISELGHEIGYHYEDLSRLSSGGLLRRFSYPVELDFDTVKTAYNAFNENLRLFRQNLSVETICMHGTPLSRTDSRLLWKYFNYRDLGIMGEPYFDLNFEDVLYLTDTGRRWNGENVSVRDKIPQIRAAVSISNPQKGQESWQTIPVSGSAMSLTEDARKLQEKHNYRKTRDIIHAVSENKLPERIMLTVHPQRWNSRFFPWIKELMVQNVKNCIKYFIVRRNSINNQ